MTPEKSAIAKYLMLCGIIAIIGFEIDGHLKMNTILEEQAAAKDRLVALDASLTIARVGITTIDARVNRLEAAQQAAEKAKADAAEKVRQEAEARAAEAAKTPPMCGKIAKVVGGLSALTTTYLGAGVGAILAPLINDLMAAGTEAGCNYAAK